VTVELLYFAAVRDLVGKPQESLTLPADARTLADLVDILEQTHPELAGRLTGVRFAIDEEFAPLEAPLHPGAVVAVIPPVAGG
jgi:molybdopterin converting factor subunit 1